MNASYKTTIKYKDLLISVKMLKVSHDNSIELNQLCKDSKERVRYKKYCPSCNKDITNEEIFKVHELVHSQDDVFNDYIKEEVIKIKEESERKDKLIKEKQKEEKEIQQEKEQEEIEK